MHTGLIGLGKMGHNLALNLKRNQHEVVAYDINAAARKKAAVENINVTASLSELTSQLGDKKIIWLMIPAGKRIDDLINEIKPFLQAGDIIIDGGNSHYKDSIRRADELGNSGIRFLDCGTSGGISGALHGLCTMIGGQKEVFEMCEPLFKSVCIDNGYLYCGPSGSGHFVKMVHNGIEYGMMQSIGEGFELLQNSGYTFNCQAIAKLWTHGSVIRGWLMELTQNVFEKDPRLDNIRGTIQSSGEGKWMVETALQKNVSTPVIALSLLMRYRSQQQDTFSGKIVAALRNEFGGHAVEESNKSRL